MVALIPPAAAPDATPVVTAPMAAAVAAATVTAVAPTIAPQPTSPVPVKQPKQPKPVAAPKAKTAPRRRVRARRVQRIVRRVDAWSVLKISFVFFMGGPHDRVASVIVCSRPGWVGVSQILTGNVIGTVKDESGAVLPGVTVTLTAGARPPVTQVTTSNRRISVSAGRGRQLHADGRARGLQHITPRKGCWSRWAARPAQRHAAPRDDGGIDHRQGRGPMVDTRRFGVTRT